MSKNAVKKVRNKRLRHDLGGINEPAKTVVVQDGRWIDEKDKSDHGKATSYEGGGFVAPRSEWIKLDFGCGANKRPGFVGVDIINFPGVDQVVDLLKPWPWKDSSVEEAHTSHFIEHLDGKERIHFANELYRVLIPDGKCQVIVPHWASCRAYGDPSHKWPPVSEFWFYYLSREWRLGAEKECPGCKGTKVTKEYPSGLEKQCVQCAGVGKLILGPNAPHTDIANCDWGFKCNFEATWGYGLHPQISLKNQEAQQFAMNFYKEACTDIIATLTCKK